MKLKKITAGKIVLVTIYMVIANVVWAITVSHDWEAVAERSFFQIALGITIIINSLY